MSDRTDNDGELKEDSPWTYPLMIIGVLLVLSGLVLYYYFGPSISDIRGDTPEASARTTPIQVMIGGNNFVIPENFTQYPRARRGGMRDSISLYAMLPDFDPYSLRNDHQFFTNEADNPVVYFEIALNRQPLSEAERVNFIYFENLESGVEEDMPFGLTFYRFANNSAYADQDLFLRVNEDGSVIAITCTRPSDIVPSPNCRRTFSIEGGLTIAYRFKRHYLDQWEMIDAGVQAMVEGFRN